jgi:hypothetical protein
VRVAAGDVGVVPGAELSFSASLVAGLAKLGCEVTLEPAQAAWPSSHQNPVRRMLTPAG